MANIFWNVLELSLVGSYVILLVLAARLLLRKSPKWCSYLLWSVVFLRLILPGLPESDFSLVPAQMQLPQSIVEEKQENDAIGNVIANGPLTNIPVTNLDDITSGVTNTPVPPHRKR